VTEFKQLSEEHLILLVKTTRDSAAFTELVIRYQHALHGFLFRFTMNYALAEDLAQDSFIKSYQNIASFKQNSTFKTWLFSIGYREFLQHKKRSGVMDKILQVFSLHKTTVIDVDPSVNIDLENELLALPEMERTAILLCDAYGMSHSEAAKVMATPLGSVKTYVKRARASMNNSMGDSDEK
jgi:RNA polymerase sigma-70 factor (ECF subfamily)